MTTTELIDMLKKVEFGASGRPREISLQIEGDYLSEPKIQILGLGDGVAGAELCLSVARKGEQYGI